MYCLLLRDNDFGDSETVYIPATTQWQKQNPATTFSFALRQLLLKLYRN